MAVEEIMERVPAEAQAALDTLHRVAEMSAFPFAEPARAALWRRPGSQDDGPAAPDDLATALA